MAQLLHILDTDYGDYMGCILTSILTILSSHFTMWCILSNCLAREKVFKILKADHIRTLLFLPLAKKYVTEHKTTYYFHIVLYCIALIRIPCILLWISACMRGLAGTPVEWWSFAYLIWNILFLALSMGQGALWDFCNDSQNISGHGGRTLDEKVFSTAESMSRLNKRKEQYQTQKEYFVSMQANQSKQWKKKYLLRLACTAQTMQAWIFYLVKRNLHSSNEERKQDISFLSNEWMQIQRWFEQTEINRTVERYTDCLIICKPYLRAFDRAKMQYLSAPPNRKEARFDRISTQISKLLERIFIVYNQLNEISYPMETILLPAVQDIIRCTEEYSRLSFELPENTQQDTASWIQDVKNDLNRLGLF
ncbi:hypothetical protein [Butyricicoccus sp.]|uniref:hypothetical protein n=1 Tax=Butyricicoccus sp. TaxID=2049021 RepID=UPI003F1846B5